MVFNAPKLDPDGSASGQRGWEDFEIGGLLR
jgi:hypothetical protein